MTVEEAIAAAESILLGHAAPDGVLDPRWQAIIEIGHFAPQEPEAAPLPEKWAMVRFRKPLQNTTLKVLIQQGASSVALMLLDGLRSCEVLQLQLEDFSFSEAHLCVLGKGNKKRLLPLPAEIIEVRQNYLRF